jgi:hypothetical protein
MPAIKMQTYPQFGAFRPEEISHDWQPNEKKPNRSERISLTENIKKGYSSAVPKSTKKIPAKVAFILDDEEKRLIQTVQTKLGINKATDVLRMGLKRLAEGIKVAG